MKRTINDAQRELVRALRTRDLLRMANFEIATSLFMLGRSNNGTHEEILERLHRELWLPIYDGDQQ